MKLKQEYDRYTIMAFALLMMDIYTLPEEVVHKKVKALSDEELIEKLSDSINIHNQKYQRMPEREIKAIANIMDAIKTGDLTRIADTINRVKSDII